MTEYETEYRANVVCPYCGSLCGEDMARGQDDDVHYECDECGKTFIYFTDYQISYTSRKADCLNDSPHEYREWITVLKKDGQVTQIRHCRDCRKDDIRTLPHFLFCEE